MPEAVLVSAVRTPVGRAPKGALSTSRPDDLAALAINGALQRVSGLDKAEVEDVILGCAQQEGEQGWNLARMAALRAELPVEVPGMTVNRLCASGLEAIAQADMRIRSGGFKVVVAGGAETMSLLPMGGLEADAESMAGRELSGFSADDGIDGRASGATLRHFAGGSGRIRSAQSSTSDCGAACRSSR